MITEILTNAREVVNNRDIRFLQEGPWSDTTQLQNLRTVDRTSSKNYLVVSSNCLC
jgi:hypothetical protein